MMNLKNILVAVDFHDAVGELLSAAEGLAEKYQAKLWIVHVAEPDPDFSSFDAGPQYIRDIKAEEFRDEHRNLQMLCDTFLSDTVEKEALFIQGTTVETLLEEIQKLQCDLLVVGTHKHSFLHYLLQESVSLKLLKKVNIPLLAIPIED